MSGPYDIRTGEVDGRFAIKFRLRQDDPATGYVLAAMRRAASRVTDRETGFTEAVESPDFDVADEVEEVLMGLLPEDLRLRFVAESDALRERVKNQAIQSLFGMGLGDIFRQLKVGDEVSRILGDTVLGNKRREDIDHMTVEDLKGP